MLLCVCLCVRVCIGAYLCMNLCGSVVLYMFACLCVYVCLGVNTHLCMHVSVYSIVCIVCACVRVC